MMRFRSGIAALSLAAWLMPHVAAAGQAAAAQPQLPVSLARIRSALKKPEGKLTTPLPAADFKVDVNEEQRFRDLLDLLDFNPNPMVPDVQFGRGTGTQPLVNFNASGAIQSAASGISKARRERAERLAREEVARALITFCETHECK